MKTILIVTASILFFAAIGGPVADSQAAIAEPLQERGLASSAAEMAGMWYSAPVGTLISFDGNGNAILGLDSRGEMIGYAADVWFEGTQLSMAFKEFAGESSVCRTAVGVYEVHKLESGGIRFVPLNDACEMRFNILSGGPDLGLDLVFHAVNSAAAAP